MRIAQVLGLQLPGCVLATVSVAAVLGLSLPAAAADDIELGEQVYTQQCVSCHGEKGLGENDEFTEPLTGDKSVPQLTNYIEKWMPEENPEDVTGEEAEAVARYIYEEFYSAIAQARNREARVELSRLTADQYRHAVSDLVGSFRPHGAPGDQRGLKAMYFNHKNPGPNRVSEKNVDNLHLEFDDPRNVHEELDLVGFAARWQGSLIVPETGEYELVVRSDHGVRLWLNTMDDPVIDRWVVSGDDTDHRTSVYLVGGRAYPLKVEFTSRNQGVNKEEEDPDPTTGFVELQWKRPHHTRETISSRYLSPKPAREVMVAETPFPPDDRSVGYERGTSISKAWHTATTDAAIETSEHVLENLNELAGTKDDADDREPKLRQFARRFVERAFRRPLDDEQRQVYIDRQFESAPDLEAAVERVVLLTLKSPRFLYLDFGAEDPDSYAVAERLSFTMWDSIPDKPLIQAAREGKLTRPDQIRQHAERMVDDLRTRTKMKAFFHHYLHLQHNPDLEKSDEAYPDFSDQLVSDLRTSLELFLDDVVWGDDPDFRRLVQSDQLYVNGRIAEYYGFDVSADASFEKVKADRPERRGVLTHPYVMGVFAYTDSTSPIHRGVFLARGVLGRTLRPPPEAFTPLAADVHPEMTNRERVAKQTEPDSCMACHELINPLGFTFEHFDAVGRFRTEDNGKEIDSSGGYELPSGEYIDFADARDLSEFLAGSEQAHQAFVLQLFHHMVKQPIRGYGQDKPIEMGSEFASDMDFDIRTLMARIAETAAVEGLDQPQAAEASDDSEPSEPSSEPNEVSEVARPRSEQVE